MSIWLACGACGPDPSRMRFPRTLLVLLVLPACGGGTSSGGGTPAPTNVLSVAGTYQITPSILSNPCGQVEVLPGPATVAQTPGASDFRLTHFSLTHSGQVQAGGAFATQPVVLAFGNGSTDTVSITGRFTTSGLEATVNVDTAHTGAAPCRYVVGWAATKQGAPNVIP